MGGKRRGGWGVSVAALGLVVMAIVVTVGRGAMGPPSAPAEFVPQVEVQGERSLLFRAQYWSAAARMWAQHPVLGVGPRGFAEHYLVTKDPLNPESVTSSHNVLIDFVSMLGVGGIAWSLLLLGWLGAAGRAAGSARFDACQPDRDLAADYRQNELRKNVKIAAAAGGVIFGICLLVLRSGLYLDTALLWLMAAGGFIAVAGVLATPGRVSDAGQRWGLFAAAAFVMVHNQVEMSFFQPGPVALLWVLLGLAGGMGAGPSVAPPPPEPRTEADGSIDASTARSTARRSWLATGGVAAALGVMTLVTAGTLSHENALAEAASALQQGRTDRALEKLTVAQHAAGFDARSLRWRVRLHALEPMSPMVDAGPARPPGIVSNRRRVGSTRRNRNRDQPPAGRDCGRGYGKAGPA